MVGYGVSIFLITIGAILRFAINLDVESIDIGAMGVILMAVGGASFALQLLLEVIRSRQPANERDHTYDGEGRRTAESSSGRSSRTRRGAASRSSSQNEEHPVP